MKWGVAGGYFADAWYLIAAGFQGNEITDCLIVAGWESHIWRMPNRQDTYT